MKRAPPSLDAVKAVFTHLVHRHVALADLNVALAEDGFQRLSEEGALALGLVTRRALSHRGRTRAIVVGFTQADVDDSWWFAEDRAHAARAARSSSP